jgi:RNA polymerase sigma-32 factor
MARSNDAAFSRYMTAARAADPLSREEELLLTRAWRDHADTEAADRLVRAHLRYVVAIALKYRRYGVPVSELVAEGNFGIVHAMKKFDPERGIRFVTYAAHWIRAYVLNYVIRSWSLVGAGSGALRSKMFFKLRRERTRIANLLGEGVDAEEALAERLGVTREQVALMLRRLDTRDLSLDAKIYDDSGTALVDSLASDAENQEVALARSANQGHLRLVVQGALEHLDDRERFIVERRLMADPDEELSLAELGRQLGVSRERARQLEVRAKRKLEPRLANLVDEPQTRARPLAHAAA